MPKYIVTWEIDPTRVPTDLKERGILWSGMVEMVKQEIRDGITSDWGVFVGETRGYSIGGQSGLELAKSLQRFYPFITFEVHQVMSIDEVDELAKFMMK